MSPIGVWLSALGFHDLCLKVVYAQSLQLTKLVSTNAFVHHDLQVGVSDPRCCVDLMTVLLCVPWLASFPKVLPMTACNMHLWGSCARGTVLVRWARRLTVSPSGMGRSVYCSHAFWHFGFMEQSEHCPPFLQMQNLGHEASRTGAERRKPASRTDFAVLCRQALSPISWPCDSCFVRKRT